MHECVKKYSHIKGFNFQPDWGCCGEEIWLNFNAERYRMLLRRGKMMFPGMNAIRIWLSFDGWYRNRLYYLENIKKAGEIITEEGLCFIPVYFNGWISMPNFGGFTAEALLPDIIDVYAIYLRESVIAFTGANVLMHDLSNEPLNNTFGNIDAIQRVFKFLERMSCELRVNDNRPVTVGTQGYLGAGDIGLFYPIIDVFSLHPYNIACLPIEAFRKQTADILDYVETFAKPVIVTECIWAPSTEKGRLIYLETELYTYTNLGLGFLCHALSVSPVADLHPLGLEITQPLGGNLYMAFLDENGEIRSDHDIFNKI